jgi:hypothetical protein
LEHYSKNTIGAKQRRGIYLNTIPFFSLHIFKDWYSIALFEIIESEKIKLARLLNKYISNKIKNQRN